MPQDDGRPGAKGRSGVDYPSIAVGKRAGGEDIGSRRTGGAWYGACGSHIDRAHDNAAAPRIIRHRRIILHPGTARELTACFDLVTTAPARPMNLDFCGIAIGHSADVVVLDCADPAAAVAELAQSETLLASLSTPVRPTMQPYPSTSLGTATVT
jgi:hypothetical protein